ncbi:MAG: molybdate ABC transporter permease subunit [Deinococcota bacterium]|nr:molybdate ABC transporter permease subunit [Allomeiothermus silvanus]
MLEPLLLTVRLALLTCLTLLLFAAPLGWLFARKDFRGKAILETLLLLPLVLPPVVLGFYILLLLGKNGPLQQWFGFSLAFTFEGVLVGLVLFNLPFALSNYREAFRAIDPTLLETARTLGAPPWRVWREIILPLAAPGLLSGTLLVFANVFGDFGVVLMIGGSLPGETQVVSVYIYELTQALRLQEANLAALVLVIISFVLMYAIRQLEARWKSVIRLATQSPSK